MPSKARFWSTASRCLGHKTSAGAGRRLHCRQPGNRFFPALISGPFHQGLAVVFAVATGLAVIAGIASVLRGGRYIHPESAEAEARVTSSV